MNQTFKNREEGKSEQPQEEKSFFAVIVHSFFVIPFLIAVFGLLLFTAITLLTREQQTVYDFLEDVKIGGASKRWQAAFELSKMLANPDLIPKEGRFIAELINAFKHAQHDDNRVRQYLALAMGRTGKNEFVQPLLEAVSIEKEENIPAIIYALGMLKDNRAVPILKNFVTHQNARIRSVAVVALGVIGEPSSKEILKKALNDPELNVQWGSALSLAQMGDDSGKKIIINLLNRKYLQSFSEVDQQEQNHILLSTLEAAAFLHDSEIDLAIEKLAQDDVNMKIRSTAMKYMDNRHSK